MLICQDLSGCELILVNDGSTDNTLDILKCYELNQDIRIIDQKNLGVSAARNAGMIMAKGKFVYFLDSDDSLTDNSLSFFRQIIQEHSDCQLIAFGYFTRKNECLGKRFIYPKLDKTVVNGNDLMTGFLCKNFCMHICSGLYNREFLLNNHLFFQEGVRIGEDILFIMKALNHIDFAYYSARPTFIYQIRDDSAMKGYTSYSLEQYHSHTLLREYLLPFAEQNKDMIRYVNFFLLFSYMSNLRYYLKSKIKNSDINKKFVDDGSIRYKRNFTRNIPLWIIMKITMFFPIGLLLKLTKR